MALRWTLQDKRKSNKGETDEANPGREGLLVRFQSGELGGL